MQWELIGTVTSFCRSRDGESQRGAGFESLSPGSLSLFFPVPRPRASGPGLGALSGRAGDGERASGRGGGDAALSVPAFRSQRCQERHGAQTKPPQRLTARGTAAAGRPPAPPPAGLDSEREAGRASPRGPTRGEDVTRRAGPGPLCRQPEKDATRNSFRPDSENQARISGKPNARAPHPGSNAISRETPARGLRRASTPTSLVTACATVSRSRKKGKQRAQPGADGTSRPLGSSAGQGCPSSRGRADRPGRDVVALCGRNQNHTNKATLTGSQTNSGPTGKGQAVTVGGPAPGLSEPRCARRPGPVLSSARSSTLGEGAPQPPGRAHPRWHLRPLPVGRSPLPTQTETARGVLLSQWEARCPHESDHGTASTSNRHRQISSRTPTRLLLTCVGDTGV